MLKSKISLTRHRSVKRGKIVLIAFLIFAIFVLNNVLRLDLIGYEYYKNKAKEQITTESALRASRGKIYDTNMNVLATEQTVWRIFVSTREIKKYIKKDKTPYNELIAKGLSEILSLEYTALLDKINNSSVLDVTIKKTASESEYKSVLEFVAKNDLENLVFTEAQSKRFYPSSTLAANVLGFTGSDNQGLYGLEYSYNSTLTGSDGYYLYAKDANGNALPSQYATYVPARDGSSIITTIDSYVQRQLENQLEIIRVNHNVQNRVCGIVMDTKTGAILAMANSSPFDPNSPYELDSTSQSKLDESGYAKDSEEYKALKNELLQIMWSNKAVSEAYEPGSTFKIITVAAALDSGVARSSDTFSCPGYHMVGGWRIKCHKTTGHGNGFSLAYGLQMSCNPTMMCLADRIGAERFYSYVKEFGYFEKTGIDLPSEARTIFHKQDALGPTELATSSFGQRFKVSIIGHLTAIAAVANDGILVEPYLVREIVDSTGKTIYEHETVVKGQVVSKEVANEVSDILEKGVSGDGGAKNAYVDGYLVSAKTGTSQKFDVLDENGASYLRIGSTVAYTNTSNTGIAVIIVVDEPQSTVKYGSVVAAPYISALLTNILPYLEFAPAVPKNTVSIKSYVGMSVSDAKKALGADGITYQIVGSGSTVVSQLPIANTEITKELTTVYIYTIKREEEMVSVPNFVGIGITDAERLAQALGINIRLEGNVNYAVGRGYKVISQSLTPGSSVQRGNVIILRIISLEFED